MERFLKMSEVDDISLEANVGAGPTQVTEAQPPARGLLALPSPGPALLLELWWPESGGARLRGRVKGGTRFLALRPRVCANATGMLAIPRFAFACEGAHSVSALVSFKVDCGGHAWKSTFPGASW